jgi:collagenase-like PrtC family protease
MAIAVTTTKLTLGPLLFHWKSNDWRDFYFRIADEAEVDAVHIGEVVCSKRMPFYDKLIPTVIERLSSAGKEVVISSQALIMSGHEQRMALDLANMRGVLVEANDITLATLLAGRQFAVGSFINVYNEGTLKVLEDMGAIRICLPPELPRERLGELASRARAELEVQVFGRLPLAISARCYAARAHNLSKDGCLYVCAENSDGMAVNTLNSRSLLAVNGTQTLSFSMVNLLAELPHLRKLGINRFRLSPHKVDMVLVARTFRDAITESLSTDAAIAQLLELCPDTEFANGYFYGEPGHKYVHAE